MVITVAWGIKGSFSCTIKWK